MRKLNWLIIAIISITLAISSCNTGNRSDHKDAGADNEVLTEVIYTCPMHPEVTSDKPGECPKCGMELVKTEDLKHDQGKDSNPDTVKL